MYNTMLTFVSSFLAFDEYLKLQAEHMGTEQAQAQGSTNTIDLTIEDLTLTSRQVIDGCVMAYHYASYYSGKSVPRRYLDAFERTMRMPMGLMCDWDTHVGGPDEDAVPFHGEADPDIGPQDVYHWYIDRRDLWQYNVCGVGRYEVRSTGRVSWIPFLWDRWRLDGLSRRRLPRYDGNGNQITHLNHQRPPVRDGVVVSA